MYIYKNDVLEHGATENCRACASLLKIGHARGYSHSGECRVKFEAVLQQTDKGKKRIQAADERLNEEVMKRSEDKVEAEEPMAEDKAEVEEEGVGEGVVGQRIRRQGAETLKGGIIFAPFLQKNNPKWFLPGSPKSIKIN